MTSRTPNVMSYKSSLVWLRRDLRLHDHAVLHEATSQSDEVFLTFVFDTNILSKLKNKNDRRVYFIFESLKELESKIQEFGSRLIILFGDPTQEIPRLAQELKVDAVFTGRDYEGYAKKRDATVEKSLKKEKISFLSFKDHVVFEGAEILTGSNTPFKVFTPYKNTWMKTVRNKDLQERKPDLKKLSSRKNLSRFSQVSKISDIGFRETDVMIMPGESAGTKRLKAFAKTVSEYKNKRDFPALDATSELSTHFRFGTISIREGVRMCQDLRTEGSRTWLSELIWRDFYHMILDQFPHVEVESFKPEYKNIKWPGKQEHFKAWVEGQTGFPLVDAAMRHFAKTGWMHNRLRMVVASFLVKDLLISWQQGEEYFAQQLLDFDLAANNGGWQWSASTGCDAQPYFRIFNPFSQSQRFDEDGEFIRRHCPELKSYSSKHIHNPSLATPMEQAEAQCIIGKDYPEPIVDHAIQREKALELFKKYK